MATIPKISIIGAGPAGLTLARLLYVSSVRFNVTIYELVSSPTSRSDQGGTLDLHADTGLAAIRKCDLWSDFSKYARTDGEEMILIDKNATELVHLKGGERGRPEIDRKLLKEILLDGVPREWLKWGRKLKDVTEDGMLRFEGSEERDGPFDLLVGADGAWSKARAKLTDLKPAYAGVSGYELEIPEPAKTCPELNKKVGRGMFFRSSDRKCLNAQRMGNNSLKVRSWFVCPEGEAQKTLDSNGKHETLKKILGWYADWAPEMTDLLREADLESLRHWTLYELPVGSTWRHKEGFTLIGDAASLSTPFSGEGVNKAMKDSLDLAELIMESQDPNGNLTLDQAVVRYEEQMFPRAKKLQVRTMNNKKNMFGPDAPIGLMTNMLKTEAAESSSVFMKALGTRPVIAVVYGYFWMRQQIGWAIRKYWRRN